LSLQRSDVDLKPGMLTFRDTKNGENRTVPLTGHALDLLVQRSCAEMSAGLVFPNKKHTKSMSLEEAWQRALRRADLHNFHFHDLRHSCASFLVKSGASLLEIAEILGHKTRNMTRRYTHLSQEHTASVVRRMNQAIFGQ